MSHSPDETGNRYGKLLVQKRAPSVRGHSRWKCRCDCGRLTVVNGGSLRSGNTTACGHCRGTHRLTGHPLQKVWIQMKQRCHNPNAEEYARYGGRGIAVCPRWSGRDGFANFIADMGERPDGHTIERIDNHGPYSPANCRWATRKEQAQNRRYVRPQDQPRDSRTGRFVKGRP